MSPFRCGCSEHVEPSLTGWSVAVFGADGRGHGGGEWTVIGCHLLLFFVPSISFPVVVPPLASAPPIYPPPVLSFRCGCSHVEPSITHGIVVVVLAQMDARMDTVSGQ